MWINGEAAAPKNGAYITRNSPAHYVPVIRAYLTEPPPMWIGP